MITLKASANNRQAIQSSMSKVKDISSVVMVDAFKKIGRSALRYAVTSPERQWEDYTGNLQDSFGFGIFRDGRLIYWEDLKEKSYEWALPGGRIPNHDPLPVGANKALDLINNHMDLFGSGFQLLVVAGMEYAMNVEVENVHKVLTIAFQFTEENWKQFFKRA